MSFVRSVPGADPIVVNARVEATPKAVFRAFTDPVVIPRWFGPRPHGLVSASVDLRIGGVWRFVERRDDFGESGFEGEYLEIKSPHLLVFSWMKYKTLEGQYEATERSKVEIRFTAQDEVTQLTIVHSGIAEDDMRRGFAGGWNGGIAQVVTMLSIPQEVPEK